MPETMTREVAADPKPTSAEGAATAREILHRAFDGVSAQVAVALKDGAILRESDGPAAATIILRSPGTLRQLFTRGSDLAASEAFIRGDIEVAGDIERTLQTMDKIAATRTARDWASIVLLIAKLPRTAAPGPMTRGPAKLHGRRHSPERDGSAIAYHYDLPSAFFELFLDDSVAYSSGYYRSESDTVHQAQAHKYDLICRKLRLREDERLLELGCGWGGLVRFAAREYGARVTGVTTSRVQLQYNRERLEREGLSDRCEIVLRDYRDLEPLGQFQKVTSIEMGEHVGDEMMQVYLKAMFDRLDPGGLLVLQNIIAYEKSPNRMKALANQFFPQRSSFTETYVFPDGKIPRLPLITQAAQDAGFEIRDVETFREHYVVTLHDWLQKLEQHEPQARAMVGDETYNIFRLWLAGSAFSFASGRLGVAQMLFAKWADDARAFVPATRNDMYA